MCGILGAVNSNVSKELFNNCLDRLSHRGPDGVGIWEDGSIKLGHRRLSIIDLSENAKQPMEILNRFVITFNGEIYNYKELRTDLEKAGCRFISNSDTEVLLYAYAEWKEKCLAKLNGMWSFAIYDKVDKTIFLSRDRVGKKPLFYHQDNNSFCFATEMKGLYPLMKNVEMNRENIDFAIKNNFLYEVTDRCLING